MFDLTDPVQLEAARAKLVSSNEANALERLESTLPTEPQKDTSFKGLLDPNEIKEQVQKAQLAKINSAYSFSGLLDAMPRTDTDAMRMAAPVLNGRLLCVDDNWYVYDGKTYVVDKGKALVKKVAKAICSAIVSCHDAAKTKYHELQEDGATVNPKAWNARESQMAGFGNSSKRSSVRAMLESEYVEDNQIFLSNRYIAFKNTVIDTVETRAQKRLVQVPHDPALYIPNRCYIDQNYVPGSTPGPALTKFLTYSFESYDDGVNLFLALAVALFSSAPKRKLFVDIFGPTDSGKSAASKIVKRLSGLYKTATKDHFGAGSDSTFALTSLQTYRAIFAHEAEYKLNPAVVKMWSGSDSIETDVKNGERIEYMPEGILFFINNRDDGVNIEMQEGDANHNRYFPVSTPYRFYKDGLTPHGFDENYAFDEDLESVKLPAEDEQTVSWMVDMWVAWETLGIDYIPLTDNQERIRKKKVGEIDIIMDAINWYSDEREVLMKKGVDEVTNSRQWVSYAEFRKLLVTYARMQDIEIPSKKDLLTLLKSRGVAQMFDQYRLPGLVLGTEWKQTVAELEADDRLGKIKDQGF